MSFPFLADRFPTPEARTPAGEPAHGRAAGRAAVDLPRPRDDDEVDASPIDGDLDAVEPAAALRLVRDLLPQRFFPFADGASIRGRFPGEAEAIVASADRWLAGHRAAQGDRDAQNRHQHLVRLAQAYAFTRDGRYARACAASLDAWLTPAPTAQGVRADAAFQVISWCWTLRLLHDAPITTGPWVARALSAIRHHAVWLERSLSQQFLSPTHRTGSALALFYAAVLFPELRDAMRWRHAAARVLLAESETQIAPDGVHVEQSTCFHAYAADTYLHFLLLLARTRAEAPPAVADRVERMFDFLLAIRRPDGSVPSIGDSDGGCLLPLSPRAGGDSRGRLAVAAALFGRGDLAWAAGGAAPELAWLMGERGLEAFDALRPAPPSSSPSRVFPSGGYAVMRTSWDREAHQMIVDVGSPGCPAGAGHGHADLLSVQCAIYGEPAIVDPGTHCYGGESKWRDYFRGTGAHSTVVIDGACQSEPTGPFGWRRRPRVRLREWHSTAEFDFVDAEHDAYTGLRDPVVHRRRVIFVKPGYWILVDDLAGRGRHDVELSFQFAGPDVRLGPHPWARAATPAGPVLWISPFPSAPAQPAVKCGEPSPTRGWISPELASLSPAPMLIYSFAVALPWRIVTLLLPDRQALPAPPAVRPIYDDGGLPHGFVFERPRRVVRFDDHAVVVERD